MGFFSDNKMSPEDIDLALNKITKMYATYTEKYGTRFFNYNEFRNRYLDALKKKINMTIFFKAEIDYLQKQESAAQEYLLLLRDEHGNETEGVLDKTINNIIAQTDGYPEIDEMNDRANIEIKRLVGVCRLIYPELSNLNIYIPVEKSTLYHQANKSIQDVVNEPYGFLYKSYLEALNNDFMAPSQLDAIGQKLIKELGMSLQTVLGILRLTDPVKAGHMVEYISKVIVDFRLDIFKPISH